LKDKSISIKIDYELQGFHSSSTNEFVLKLVDRNFLDNLDSIGKILSTRQLYSDNYFNQINPTVSNLKNYLLEGPINNPNHYLFTLLDLDMKIILCCGFKVSQSNTVEIDNVMRLSPQYPGLMYSALSAMIAWINENFRVSCIHLRVSSNNKSAINLYEKLGFSLTQTSYLKKIYTSDSEYRLVPCENKDPSSNIKMYRMELINT
jgi:RimJ/RimL family protein N-acetyltransferase